MARVALKRLQLALYDLGFEPGPIDGVWGPKTRGACEDAGRFSGRLLVGRRGVELIREWEKLKLRAYKDVGEVWTIGWGNTRYEDGTPVKEGDEVSELEAELLFAHYVQGFGLVVDKVLGVEVEDNQFGALVSFAYNVGESAFSESTLLVRVNKDPLDEEIAGYSVGEDGIAEEDSCEFMRWVRVAGEVNKGLRRRRQAECDLYLKES